MCGLALVLDLDQPISKTLIPALFATMSHRGPDDQGVYHSQHLLACHSRLAVESSLSQGKQPIVSRDGRYVALVNGELYPHASLRQSLQAWGYPFFGDSDSELALGLYLRYGDKFVQYLRGEFVVAIWDTAAQRLVIVRDRFGIKPLVYAHNAKRWLFASEAKTLFAAGLEPRWNVCGLADSFSFQYLLPGKSLFAGIRQLAPGHMLTIENQKLELKAYWQPSYTNPIARKPHTLTAQVLKALNTSVKIRMPRSHPAAFTLSGGLDSSAIVALAQGHADYPLQCYCVSFDAMHYDELPLAQQFAQQRGLRLKRVNICRDTLILDIHKAAYFSEGLASNGQYAGKFQLYQHIAADGYRVVMSGEGADEAFMGYAHLVHQYLSSTPAIDNREGLMKALQQQAYLQKGLMYSEAQPKQDMPNFLLAKIAFCSQLPPLFTQDFRPIFNEAQQQSFRQLNNLLIHCQQQANSATETSALLWQQLVLSGYILKTLGDGMEMAASIEARLPFLDHKLFELAMRLPTHTKIVGTQGKAILRQSLQTVLPQALLKRNKHPFIAPPISQGLSSATEDYLFDTLCSHAMAKSGVFDINKLENYLNRWRNAKPKEKTLLDPVIMMLLSFSALQNHFNLSIK